MAPLYLRRCSGPVPCGCLLHPVGQQGEETGALDRPRQLALLLGGHCGDAARHALAALGNEARQQLDVLVVDRRSVRTRERAGLATTEERTTRTATRAATSGRCGTHACSPSNSVRRGGRGPRSPRSPRSPSKRRPPRSEEPRVGEATETG